MDYVVVFTDLCLCCLLQVWGEGCWGEGFAVFALNIQNPYSISKYMGGGELFAFRAFAFTSGSISQNLHLKWFFWQKFDPDATIWKNTWLRYISKICLEMFYCPFQFIWLKYDKNVFLMSRFRYTFYMCNLLASCRLRVLFPF